MSNIKVNPVQEIKQKEEEAAKTILNAQEKAKRDLSGLIRQKESELKQKTEEANKEAEENLRDIQRKVNLHISGAKTKVAIKAKNIKEESQDKVAGAVNFVVEKLINTNTK